VDATPSAVIAAPDLTADGNLPAIAERGLPRFVLPVADSTPFNASPWLADHSMFFSVFGSNASRQSLLHALQNAFQDLSQIVELQCCLVGGSFVDLFNPAPNDIDIVAFYRVPDGAPFEPDGSSSAIAKIPVGADRHALCALRCRAQALGEADLVLYLALLC